MAASLPKRLTSREVQSLDLRMAKASIDVHREASPEDAAASPCAVSLVLETLTEIGMDDKEACYYMAFDASQFSRVKAGRARLPVDAIWRLPDRFWLAFHRRITEAKGLSHERATEIRARRIGELVQLLVETAS